MPETGVSRTQGRIGLIVFLAVLMIFLGLAAALIAPYTLAILAGILLTVLSRPAFSWLCRKGLGPKISALIVVVALLSLFIGPISTFLAIAVRQATALGETLAERHLLTLDVLTDKIASLSPVDELLGGAEALKKQLRSGIQNSGRVITGALLTLAGKLPNLVVQLFLALLTCFFLLLDGGAFIAWLRDKLPLDRDVQRNLAKSFQDTSISVVWSTLAAALTQSACMFIAFTVLRVPGAFLAAGATFLFAWIPFLGSTPVWLAAVVYLYTQGAFLKLFVMLGAGLFTGVIDNFVRPLVLKGRSDMHPLVSLIAIFGGIQLFGILGVFIGPIVAGIVTSLLQIWPVVGRKFGVL